MDRNEVNLRYIYAKLPAATAEQIGLIAAFICGLSIAGWSEDGARMSATSATHEKE